jgi:hypothetical protein
VLVTVCAGVGPAAVVRETVHRIETVDETVYLHFSPNPQGTKVVVPAAQLVQLRRGGPGGEPDDLALSWGGGEVHIKLMSDAARIAKWRRKIDALRLTSDTDVGVMRADTALLQEMLDHEAEAAPAPLATALNDLAVELRFRRLQWGLIERDPLDGYPHDGDDDYDDSAAESDYEW